MGNLAQPRCLLAIAAMAALASSCTPPVASAPCNADDDCAATEVCVRGSCSDGAPLSPRPDAGHLPDPSSPDGGGQPDAGPAPNDAGDEGVDSGPSSADGGDPLLDGGGPGGDGGGPDPVLDAGPPGIVSFTATPSSVALGESTTLAWEGHELVSCRVEGVPGTLDPSGALVIERPASRPYTLRCVDADGAEHTAEVTVEVTCAVVSLPSLVIASDDDLAAFAATHAGTCVDVTGDVFVENVTQTDLSELYGLREVGGDLNVGGGPNLTHLTGLELLRTVGGDLRLGYQEAAADPLMALPALTSLHGLSALERVGLDLQIHEADSLTTLVGLERLTTIGDDLEITNSEAIADLQGLSRLTTIDSQLELDYGALTSLDGLSALTSLGSLYLTHLPALTDISALANVSGTLWSIYVNDCDALEELTGLENVTAISSYVTIQWNSGLRTLGGLSGLETAERIVIRHNVGLVDVDLPALATVSYTGTQNCSGDYCDGDLVIVGNDAVDTLAGFPALTFVDSDLVIVDNTSLATISAFPVLTRVDNDLEIESNPQLTSITGLLALESADDLFLEQNPALVELSLPALTSINDDVLVIDNDALASLSGLHHLVSAGGDLVIEGNGALTALELTDLTSVGDYPTCARGCRFHIRYNASLPVAVGQDLLARTPRPVDDVDATTNIDVVTGNRP